MRPYTAANKRHRILQWKSLTLDLDAVRAQAGETVLAIGPVEFALLHLMVSRRNVPLSKGAILISLFGAEQDRDPRLVDVYVARLRTALASAGLPDLVGSMAGRGYGVFDADERTDEPALPRRPSCSDATTMVAA